MTWGIASYGSTVWGGVGAASGIGSGGAPGILTNTKPLADGQYTATALDAATLTIKLFDNLSDTSLKGWRAVFYRAGVFESRVVEESSSMQLVLDHPLDTPTTMGERIWLVEDRAWRGDDLQFTVGCADAMNKRLDHGSIQLSLLATSSAFDGDAPAYTIGSPQAAHSGKGVENGDTESFLLDDTAAPSVPLSFWTTNDAFKGLDFTVSRGSAAGQTRSVVRYVATERRIYFDQSLSTPTDTTSVFSLSLPSFAGWYHTSQPNQHPDTVSVRADKVGLVVEHDGASNTKNTLVLVERSAAKADMPVVMSAIVSFNSATFDATPNPFCGLCFGLLARDPHDRYTPIALYAQVTHTNPAGVGNSVLRLWDYAGGYVEHVLHTAITVASLQYTVLSVVAAYERALDRMTIRVTQLPAIPHTSLSAQTLCFLSLDAYSTNPARLWEVVEDLRHGDYGFLSVGGEGYAAEAQIVRMSLASRGVPLIKDGRPQALSSAYLASSQAYAPRQGRDMTQQPCLWRPSHTRAESTQAVADGHAIRQEGNVTWLSNPAEQEEPVFLSRHFWSLNKDPSSFVCEFTAIVRSEGYRYYDTTGVQFSAVFNRGGRAKELRLAFLLDINRRYIGLLLSGAPYDGRFRSEFLSFDHDWRNLTEYRVLYDARHDVLSVWADGSPEEAAAPKLLLSGTQLDYLPDATGRPFTKDRVTAGMFLGITWQLHTAAEMEVMRLWGAADMSGYTSYYGDDSQGWSLLHVPATLPNEAPFTDVPTQEAGGLLTYYKHALQDLSVTSTPFFSKYVRAQSSLGRAYYTRPLVGAGIDRDAWLVPRQGFVLDFTLTLGALAPYPRHGTFPTLQEAGFWTGAGLLLDDGESQTVIGLAHAGRGEEWIFVAPLPRGTTEATREQATQDWLREAVRHPGAHDTYFARVRWQQDIPVRYRVVRSGMASADNAALLTVFAFRGTDPLSQYRPVIVAPVPALRGCATTGTPSLRWGNLTSDTYVTSTWGEVLLGTTSEFVFQAYMEEVRQRMEENGDFDARTRFSQVLMTCQEVG